MTPIHRTGATDRTAPSGPERVRLMLAMTTAVRTPMTTSPPRHIQPCGDTVAQA